MSLAQLIFQCWTVGHRPVYNLAVSFWVHCPPADQLSVTMGIAQPLSDRTVREAPPSEEDVAGRPLRGTTDFPQEAQGENLGVSSRGLRGPTLLTFHIQLHEYLRMRL